MSINSTNETFEKILLIELLGFTTCMLYIKFVIEPDMKELHEKIKKME
jgi:hypothetical protein